ncbi:hypothetical protein YC2023_042254 [Brassica napus]
MEGASSWPTKFSLFIHGIIHDEHFVDGKIPNKTLAVGKNSRRRRFVGKFMTPIMNRVRPQFLTRFKNIVREIMSGHRFVNGECIPTGLEKIKAGSPTNKKAAKRIRTLYL